MMVRQSSTAKVNPLTPENRHISSPLETSVSRISSSTQVIILVPSGVTATAPAVCKGPIDRAFLNLDKV